MTARSLSELAYEAVNLTALCEGLDVLADTATSIPFPEDMPLNCDVRRASNALPALIDTLVDRMSRLADDIEALDTAGAE